jgi:hypothetical protein
MKYKHLVSLIAVLAVMLALVSHTEAGENRYVQTNLVSDTNSAAQGTFNDPDLLNPWGVAFFPGGPFWIADNGAGVSTLYDGTGAKEALTVTIPAGADTSPGAPGPSGMVWNGNPMAFMVGTPAAAALFIWATEDGTIAAWQPALGTSAQIVVPNSDLTTGPVYKGLAIGNNSSGLFLFATDFRGPRSRYGTPHLLSMRRSARNLSTTGYPMGSPRLVSRTSAVSSGSPMPNRILRSTIPLMELGMASWMSSIQTAI